MADAAVAPSAPVSSPKKGKAAKAKKPRTAPNHPKTSDMVNAAITNLKERGGSSLQAIKKYVGATYKVDVEKLSPFIKKYLKSAVSNGKLVQTKGKGASGSFKLNAGKAEKKVAKKKVAAKKPKSATKPAAKKTGEGKKKPAAKSPKKKKAAKPAKKAGEKKKTAAPKPKKAKSPKKEKKAKSPKKPKPKKAAAKKATPKK
jgi:histone H1/5